MVLLLLLSSIWTHGSTLPLCMNSDINCTAIKKAYTPESRVVWYNCSSTAAARQQLRSQPEDGSTGGEAAVAQL
jgi:hypothetical protein